MSTIGRSSSTSYIIEDSGSSLKIVAPSRKYWFLTVFIGIWLVGWIIGEAAASRALVNIVLGLFIPSEWSPTDPVAYWIVIPLLSISLALWTVAGIFAIRTFFWQLVGKELIEVSSRSITIHRQIIGLHKPKTYLVEHIENMRVLPNMPLSTTSFYGIGDGSIAFDYWEKTIKFVSGNDETKAREILGAIQRRFPQYRTNWSDVSSRLLARSRESCSKGQTLR